MIASANGEHELYNLQADPEEELNVFLTPRDDGGFQRFKHYPDYAAVIGELVVRMKNWADAMSDERGLELADDVAKSIAPRLEALEKA